MTAHDLLDALSLPPSTRVDRRVPKTLLIEHAPTAADRRLVQSGVERLQWTHALKPTTAGIPAFRDDDREILEIAILHLTARPDTKPARLVETVHRAIPYPIVLITELLAGEGHAHASEGCLSLAYKRTALDGTGRVVLDGDLAESPRAADTSPEATRPFLDSLPLAKQPQTSLHAVYQAWTDAVIALDAARIVGRFALPSSPTHAQVRRVALTEIERLNAEIARVRRAATREKQIARRADLNLSLARLRADRQTAFDTL